MLCGFKWWPSDGRCLHLGRLEESWSEETVGLHLGTDQLRTRDWCIPWRERLGAWELWGQMPIQKQQEITTEARQGTHNAEGSGEMQGIHLKTGVAETSEEGEKMMPRRSGLPKQTTTRTTVRQWRVSSRRTRRVGRGVREALRQHLRRGS